MSIEIVGPERSETTITPIDGRLATIVTNASAAASCRVEVRSSMSLVATISAFAARTIDVGDYCFRTHIERVVLSNLMAVGAEQECGHGMRYRPVALAHPA